MTTPDTPIEYITTAQAAQKHGCSPQRIRALLAQKRIAPEPKRHGLNFMIAANFTVLPHAGRPRKMAKIGQPK